MKWALWIGVALAGWYGIREAVTVVTGYSQEGSLRSGQRLCHITVITFCVMGIATGFWLDMWWLPFLGILVSVAFRSFVRASGRDFGAADKQ